MIRILYNKNNGDKIEIDTSFVTFNFDHPV